MNRKEQEYQLWENWKKHNDLESRNKLVTSLTPLLMNEINKYTAAPLPKTALEAEARILAVKAIDTYDPNKAQLNTHVVNNLKHLQRYVLTYQNIGKIPEHRGIAIGKYQSTYDNLYEDLNREPTITELADALHWSPAEVDRMQKELRKDLNIMTESDDADVINNFFDYSFDSGNNEIKNAIEFVYYDASEENKKILEYTFGLGGNKILSPAEIAQKINKTEYYVKTQLKKLAKEIQNARMY